MTGGFDREGGRGAALGGVLAWHRDAFIRKIEGAERAANALISAHSGDHLVPAGWESSVRYRVRNGGLTYTKAPAYFFAPEGITDD